MPKKWKLKQQAQTALPADPAVAARFRFQHLNYGDCPEDEPPARFGFLCPRRPGLWCSGLLINGADLRDGDRVTRQAGGPAVWDWDGNRVAPTFSPSINCLAHNPKNPAEKYAGCGWHGHITKGKFT